MLGWLTKRATGLAPRNLVTPLTSLRPEVQGPCFALVAEAHNLGLTHLTVRATQLTAPSEFGPQPLPDYEITVRRIERQP